MSKKGLSWVFAFALGMAVSAFGGNLWTHTADAQTEGKALEKEFINPTSMGFTNTVTVKAAGVKTIYISGQVGTGESGIPEGLAEQAGLAFKNIVKQLEDAGATTEDVVKLNVYIKNMDSTMLQPIGAAQAKYFTHKNKPASTWVGVTGLVYPQLLLEVEATAVIEDK